MGLCYPLSMDDQRTLPQNYDGPVCIWDIDKTYLATHFSSFRGLARIPIEFAVDKQAIAGMPEILRGLRRGPGPSFACTPMYFVSASPPQLRKVLANRMLLDGVEYDGITSKDWIKTLTQLRPGRLREQIGFKLCALLAGRQRRLLAQEYLFGDDVEKDAEAYHLYARLISGTLSSDDAERCMKAKGVHRDDRRCVFALLDTLPKKKGTVKRIFVHLERRTPPSRFEHLGELVVPVNGACQLGLALYETGLVDRETVVQAYEAVKASSVLTRTSVAGLLAEAHERGLISAGKLRELAL